ncbi:MAG: MBL fold metallo-hydrolase [Alphaproteobacteria bacterium]|nr:MBL fold metallo-hydrolase [Alphaproteobacteria bacterium]
MSSTATASPDLAARRLAPIERLDLRVLVDNVTDSLSSNPVFVQPEWAGIRAVGMTEISGECLCCGNHGLSIVATAVSGQGNAGLLFDGGPEGYAVQRNGFRLGVDFGAINAAVLSHGHWEYAGGLPMALSLMRQANTERVPDMYVHPDMFHQRGTRHPNGDTLAHKTIPSAAEMESIGARVVASASPVTILDHRFYVSGEIPRVTAYETGVLNHMRRTKDGKDWEPDPLIMDERYVAAHVRGKGLVVLTACSHAGVVNVLTHARSAFPEIPLHAVIGGLHLSGPTEARITETVRDLAAFKPRYVIPAHCTGWRVVVALVQALGESVVVPAAVGKRFTFAG